MQYGMQWTVIPECGYPLTRESGINEMNRFYQLTPELRPPNYVLSRRAINHKVAKYV